MINVSSSKGLSFKNDGPFLRPGMMPEFLLF